MKAASRLGLADRIASIEADPRFRRLAGRLPIARKRAGDLFDLCAGFVYSQILLACVELDLPERLRNRVVDPAQLAPEIGLTIERAQTLLAAASSLRIAAPRRGGYGLGPMGAALIDNPGVIAMIRHHRHLYEDLRDPVAVLRGAVTTSLGEFWPYAKGEVSDSGAVDYSALMEASQALVASEVLDAYSTRRHRMLLDVGGGSGAFVAAAAARAPWLRVALFDLPEVAAIARERLGSTASVFEGSFRTDPLPAGADLITLVRILHDHDDDVAFGLLCEIRRALAPGGRLLIAEPMAGTRGALAAGEGYFGFYLMAMGSGRPRSPKVIRAMLRAAGFTRTRLVGTRTPLLARVIVAA